MKKIMLCCSAGMSTSLVMKKMKKAADAMGIETEIEAFGASEFDERAPHYDVVLLGPQIKYMLKDFQKKGEALGIAVAAINPMDYGMQKGEKILKEALSLLETA
ncbi:PTS sugar transporter subunit IIB [Dongshaea marina]|uniref:PTS sugar transporter subunit IIB n=1 Tax=Dongshaea marina TaxID=2047966 RepID=UPI000D3E5835|nr:PTS sugar transporter subunit IIB [Dongshaea marina]